MMPETYKLAKVMENQGQNYLDDEIDLMALMASLFFYKWWIFGAALLFLFVGILIGYVSTPIYKADALIQVEQKTGGMPGLNQIAEMTGSETESAAEIEIIRSRSTLGQTVKNLNLEIVAMPKYFPLIGQPVARGFSPDAKQNLANPLIALRSYAWGGESITVDQLEVSKGLINKPMTLIAGENGQYEVVYDDQLMVKGLVGAISRSEQQNTPHSTSISLLVSQLNARPGTEFSILKKSYLATVNNLQSAISITEKGKNTNILTVAYESPYPLQAANIVDDIARVYVLQNVKRTSEEAEKSLEFLHQSLPEMRKKLELAENNLNQYRLNTQSVDISIETKSILDQVVAIDSQLSELGLKQTELGRIFKQEHPSYQALLKQIKQLEGQKEKLMASVKALPETQQELLRLNRDVKVGTQIYTQMLEKVQELDIVRAGTVGNVRIIDQASVDVTRPVKPQKNLIALMSALLGFTISVLIILVYQAFRRGITNPDELEQLGLPVYAVLPQSKEQEKISEAMKKYSSGKSTENKKAYLLAHENPADICVESFRSLRTSLHFAILDADHSTFMITSPSPGAGKSFVSGNLAVVQAQAGKSVLLIDADMRKGHIHKVFAIGNKTGLSELLSGNADYNEVVQATNIENLSCVSSGSYPPNPSELLMSQNFKNFLSIAQNKFDLILIDTPPIMAVTDAAIIGQHVGATLMVVRFDFNTLKEVETALNRFEKSNVSVKGVVLNGIKKHAAAYYGNGYYHYV